MKFVSRPGTFARAHLSQRGSRGSSSGFEPMRIRRGQRPQRRLPLAEQLPEHVVELCLVRELPLGGDLVDDLRQCLADDFCGLFP